MTMEQRKLAQELAKKRELAQKQRQAQMQAPKVPGGDLKHKLTEKLAQRKDERKEVIEKLARDEARRRKVAVIIILVVAGVLVVLGAGWGLSAAKAKREKEILAGQKKQEVVAVERFVKAMLQDYAKTGPESLKRCWSPQATDLARGAGEARLKEVERPAGVVVDKTLPGSAPDTFETICREDNDKTFVVGTRYQEGSCLIISLE